MARVGTARAGMGRLALVVMAAGLIAAVVEMAVVLPIQAVVLHNPPVRVFQSIAMGTLGRAAFTGGWSTGLQGVVWHTVISVAFAAAYVAAAVRWPAILARPIASGVGLGVIAYVIMIFMVIPVSRIGFNMPAANVLTLISFAIHLFAFGVPIAVVAKALLAQGPG